MITKKNLWFLTLFSIILVMSIYYISVPNNNLSKPVNVVNNEENDLSVTIKESDALTALRVNRDEELVNQVSKIKDILSDSKKTAEEKNDAYETLKYLNNTKGKEEVLEKLIKENYNYDNFIKVDGNNIKVVMDTKEHSYELANKIINTVQKEFDEKMYITVNFQTK